MINKLFQYPKGSKYCANKNPQPSGPGVVVFVRACAWISYFLFSADGPPEQRRVGLFDTV